MSVIGYVDGIALIVSEASKETVGDHGVVVKGRSLEWASVMRVK